MGMNLRFGDVDSVILKTLTIDFGPTSANLTSNLDIPVAEVKAGDFCILSKKTNVAGLGIVNVRCDVDGTLNVRFMNTTAGTINPGADDYDLLILRP